MERKEVKIQAPEGYEVDKEKSTFEEIVFKKVDFLSNLPKTWEEYCKQTKGCESYFHTRYPEPCIRKSPSFDGVYCEFSTEERVEQYVALGRLIQLRDYWVGDWKRNPNNLANTYAIYNNEVRNTVVVKVYGENYPLTFPTKEIAEKFKECFGDLIKKAYPLV